MFRYLKLTDSYYNSIPDDDLIAKQRYKLFRTTSVVGTLACYLFMVQSLTMVSVWHPVVLLTFFIGSIFFINMLLLPYHKKDIAAYVAICITSASLIHLHMYFSGGIRASSAFYLAPITLMSFMLLGNKIGRLMFLLVTANVVYFYCVTEFTDIINYDIVGTGDDQINFDYLLTGIFAAFILSAQLNYLESGKNIVIQRITQQRNELRLKNRELRKLSIVASKADNAILITDEHGIAQWVNDGFSRLTGYDSSEVVGNNPLDLLNCQGTDNAQLQYLKNSVKEKQAFTGELMKCRKDGSKFWTQVTMTPITTENNEQAFIFIESDITPRKIVEEKMKLYMLDLEKTNQELDKFAYVVSHDLKAPLRAIGNLTGWIEEDMGDKLPEEVRAHFNTIKGRVVRMEDLINGILDYTKAAKKEGRLETFRCEDMLRDTIDLIGAPSNAVIHIRENMPEITAEKVKLQQVFMNLVHNAVKYNDREDIMVEIGCNDKNTHWEFFVKDNGPGIEPRFHEKIFVIFQTLNARDEVESRGVGLAIVKKITEEEGGSIRVESDKGKGACFYFTWPKKKKASIEEIVLPETEQV